MKQFNKILIVLLSIFTLFSCQNNSKKQEQANETPEAFQEHTVLEDVSSYSKRGKYETLTDKLYNELIEKDTELKQIEEAIEKIETPPQEVYDNILKNNVFLTNNSKYYSEVKPILNDSTPNMHTALKSYTSKIQDSTLHEKMTKIVFESEQKYILKIKNLEKLNKLLEQKSIELYDYKVALKISATLKSMEDYQDKFKQDTANIKVLIKRYDDLINTMKNKINN